MKIHLKSVFQITILDRLRILALPESRFHLSFCVYCVRVRVRMRCVLYVYVYQDTCDVCGYVDFKLLLRLFHETVCVVIVTAGSDVGGLTTVPCELHASLWNE